MAAGLTPGAGFVAQHAAAAMAPPCPDGKAACGRRRAAGNRDLALGDALRGGFHLAVDDPGSRRGEVPLLRASAARQPWLARHLHGRTLRFVPGGAAERPGSAVTRRT